MADPLIGQLQPFGFNWAPSHWIGCFGQLQAIASSQALYSLIGDRFGGDARVTFGIPDLRGRRCIGSGQGPATSNYIWGVKGGVEQVALVTENLPSHSHPLSSVTPPTITASTTMDDAIINSTASVKANSAGNNAYQPSNTYPAMNPGDVIYSTTHDNSKMASDMVTVTSTLSKLDLTTTGTVDLEGTSTGNTGSGAAFSIIGPYQVIGCYAICEIGSYPARN